MNWIDRPAPPPMQHRAPATHRPVPERVWLRCAGCHATIFARDVEANQGVCPRCAHHAGIGARARLERLLDIGSAVEIGANLAPRDALRFGDSAPYSERLRRAGTESSEADALVAMTGVIAGSDRSVSIACFEYRFMGGSMGSVVGERFVRAVDAACERRLPFICITASGGARMQEGLYSLMQMSKTAAAIADLRRARLPFISILTNPTMGGVSASFAFLADIVIAEPGALIGFAGPRVIEQTLRTTLPAGFQRAEFQQDKGAVDLIVDRREHAATLCRVLGFLQAGRPEQRNVIDRRRTT